MTRLIVNGVPHDLGMHGPDSLLSVLRERLGLRGTKDACEEGECGSCSVLLDGEVVCSCLVMAADAHDRAVVTIEGLGTSSDLDPVQAAFIEQGAVQCGFCTPGLVVAVTAMLRDHPDPTDDEIREALAGNLCRCTGYGAILRAVRSMIGGPA